MMHVLQYLGDVITKIVNRETDQINQARVKMLVYILASYVLFTGILIIAYSFGGQKLHLIRVSIVFGSTLIFIAIVYFTTAWKLVSHAVLAFLTLAVWTNISIYVQDVNIETLQFIWFACALSFYMHGLKWGWFYSLINVLPVIVFTATDSKNYFYFGVGPQQVSHITYLFVTSYNFVLIVFLQHYFFKVFNHNLIGLTQTKDELKELNRKLGITLSEMEEISSARMDFLSTMSHELRTPLNGVIGISNALLLQDPRADQAENLAVLKFSAESLLLLINDVLDFNKIDSDKMELEHIPFDLVMLIKNNFSSLKLKAGEKMLDLKLSIAPDLEGKVVVSDPTRLTQVLLNLLNNAIKFTEKGTVGLFTETVRLTEDIITVRFIIEDSGVGIDLKRQKDIFEPFIQAAASTSRRYGGTGLGLPIVKKVLALFNANVELTSAPNAGSRFSFNIDFKYQKADTVRPIKIVTDKRRLAKLKVLVAEDNPVNILVIKNTLEQWGIQPVIAKNGLIALQELEYADFDIILMDIYMPEMDGYQAAVSVREMADITKASIPIIAMTATVSDNVNEKIIEAGMNDYLSKPFDPDHLFEKLERLTVNSKHLSE